MLEQFFLFWRYISIYNFTYNVIFGENPIGRRGEQKTPENARPEIDKKKNNVQRVWRQMTFYN